MTQTPSEAMPTDTPTVEQMVRKIAEWMGLKNFRFVDGTGVYDGETLHPFNPHTMAADRERVMLAMTVRDTMEFRPFPKSDGYWFHVLTRFGNYVGEGQTLGLAFVTAVYQWILAQENSDAKI